ncbi:hypothetical protein PCO31111_03470 [Pandoraea communis]|uniref:Uncharacterized protein n=1 Tax=Pandoraea communis TaxID=2508297 RepID=A0A5E4WQW7_9BURK|nr:hypothetical protein [Pandoraea communis]VVE27317.1 hypothetical protein PCO31111_03470 [Pandoraea communis]
MPKCGEKHHKARLPDAKVREMRAMYHENSNCGHRKGYGALGRIFGCSEWTARDIVTYRTRIGA